MCNTRDDNEVDIESLNQKLDAHLQTVFDVPTEADVLRYKPIIDDILRNPGINDIEFKRLKGRHGFSGKNSFLLQVYDILKLKGQVDYTKEAQIRARLRIKKGRSQSGVLVITIFTSPYPEYVDDSGNHVVQSFTCKWNCHYCPNEPGQPRSYLKGEPGVLRANRNNFDTCLQMWDRMQALYHIGHPVDKLEVLVLGGTWSSYPKQYQEQFCRDIYYAANTFIDTAPRRQPTSLQQEKIINRSSACKVIGLTLETRPDCITPQEIQAFRQYGCTRVQLGVQHIDEDVLRRINRKCTTDQVKSAIKLLKDNCFKIDIHLMPNLPGSSSVKDRKMLLDTFLGTRLPVPKRVHKLNELYEVYDLRAPDLQADQWKLYPCAIVPWTEIETEYKAGTYIPYSENELTDILLDTLALIFPWIRINRLIRDIPATYIIRSSDNPNMRQELDEQLRREGKSSQEIRSREVKGQHWDGTYIIVIREYNASDGTEFFISAESKNTKTIYGFCRLRIPSKNGTIIFPELTDTALIRELHVYGFLQMTINARSPHQHVQHQGIGRVLLNKSYDISKKHGYTRIAVISGEGVRGYYEQRGFKDATGDGHFMIRTID